MQHLCRQRYRRDRNQHGEDSGTQVQNEHGPQQTHQSCLAPFFLQWNTIANDRLERTHADEALDGFDIGVQQHHESEAIRPVATTEQTAAMPRPLSTRPKFFRIRLVIVPIKPLVLLVPGAGVEPA